jgi:hypothetical protein
VIAFRQAGYSGARFPRLCQSLSGSSGRVLPKYRWTWTFEPVPRTETESPRYVGSIWWDVNLADTMRNWRLTTRAMARSIVTRLQAGCLRNQGSFPCKDMAFILLIMLGPGPRLTEIPSACVPGNEAHQSPASSAEHQYA